MATHRQACCILDDVLRLPDGVSRWHADRLRGRGHLTSAQGRPVQASPSEIALILLSLLLGSPATTAADMVPEYAALGSEDGRTLETALASFVADPHDFFELRLATDAPAATIVFRGTDNGMRVANFGTDVFHPKPAFDRLAVIGADAMTRLSTALNHAPAVRVGRRRSADRYRINIRK